MPLWTNAEKKPVAPILQEANGIARGMGKETNTLHLLLAMMRHGDKCSCRLAEMLWLAEDYVSAMSARMHDHPGTMLTVLDNTVLMARSRKGRNVRSCELLLAMLLCKECAVRRIVNTAMELSGRTLALVRRIDGRTIIAGLTVLDSQ